MSAKQSIIKPTVGRVVLFHPAKLSAENGFVYHGNDEPLAAIIAHVWSDRMVNLAVFDFDGNAHGKTSVDLVQPGDPIPSDGFYCRWMDYQLGQAAKTEAVEDCRSEAQLRLTALELAVRVCDSSSMAEDAARRFLAFLKGTAGKPEMTAFELGAAARAAGPTSY